tara:strand:- start:472 stop:834 length:363 start_codon:yes stop_codon:yes gene_type:complete
MMTEIIIRYLENRIAKRLESKLERINWGLYYNGDFQEPSQDDIIKDEFDEHFSIDSALDYYACNYMAAIGPVVDYMRAETKEKWGEGNIQATFDNWAVDTAHNLFPKLLERVKSEWLLNN